MTAREIIYLLGGRRVLADHLGITPKSVDHWYYEGIPAKYWPKLARLGAELGFRQISIDALETHESDPTRPAP